MKQERCGLLSQTEVTELVKESGFYVRDGEVFTPLLEHLPINEAVEKLTFLVEQAALERAALHFDKRGKYKDGTWSTGWYEPHEPGEIIRALDKGEEIQ